MRMTVITLLAILAGTTSSCVSFPERAPAITGDARACSGANVELDEATDHFGIALPSDALDVKFYSDVHPMFGEYGLELVFTVGSKSFGRFIADNGFSKPKKEEFGYVPPLFDDECPRVLNSPENPASAEKEFAGSTVNLWVIPVADGRITVAITAYDV